MLPPSHHGLTGVVGEEAEMLVQGRRSLVSIGGVLAILGLVALPGTAGGAGTRTLAQAQSAG
jgi:hypothetical protein